MFSQWEPTIEERRVRSLCLTPKPLSVGSTEAACVPLLNIIFSLWQFLYRSLSCQDPVTSLFLCHLGLGIITISVLLALGYHCVVVFASCFLISLNSSHNFASGFFIKSSSSPLSMAFFFPCWDTDRYATQRVNVIRAQQFVHKV